jgi:hypothetical protein
MTPVVVLIAVGGAIILSGATIAAWFVWGMVQEFEE